MPCYDAPPPWDEAKRKNAEAAVRMLCAIVRRDIAEAKPLDRPLLSWFLAHRQIDLQIATTPWHGKPNAADEAAARADIAKVKELLGE